MNSSSQHLLVVDDEPKLRELVKAYLTKEGYIVGAVKDGPSLDQYLKTNDVDLVILDLMLPGEDGLSIGRRLRQQNNLPIIILSARCEELDRIVGLEMGADDYLGKPFNPRELLARIRSVLRRSQADNEESETEAKNNLFFGPYCLNIEKYQLTKDDEIISLTIGEFTLLRIFLENPNRVLNREQLLEKTKGYNYSPLDRSVDVCVGRLRRKIEINPAEPSYLQTIWGAGYLFTIDG